MIEVDISNIWGSFSLRDLLGLEQQVFRAHMDITGEGSLPWMTLPEESRCDALLALGEEIREAGELLVVIGGELSRSVIELLRGKNRNLQKGQYPIVFAEEELSTTGRRELLALLEGKSFSVCVESDSRFWDSLTLRELKWLLERRWGTDEAHSRIHTDPWGLLPMAAAGLDIRELLRGMEDARREMDLRSYDNPAWLYAAARTLLESRGRHTEVLLTAGPETDALGRWWRGQFSQGGLLNLWGRMPGDMGSLLRSGSFGTMLRFDAPEQRVRIGQDIHDSRGLNALADRTLDEVEAESWEWAVEHCTDLGVPSVGINCGALTEHTAGSLFWFFRLSAGLCRRLSGEEPGQDFEPLLLRRLQG